MGHKGFRIIVDLSAFYKDHRNVARIFIKTKQMSTIRDVKEHIASLFQITDFFLVATGHFLPDSENINVLNNEELVVVTPNNAEPASDPAPKSEAATTTETSAPKKKKRKLQIETIPEEVPAKLKKRHKSKKVITYDVEDSDEAPSLSQNGPTPQETEAGTRSVAQSTVISSYRMPCLDTAVRLSRRVDSPTVFTKYVPPAMITSKYLAEKKINIVKIDLIKNDSAAQSISEEECELKTNEIVPKELVKHDSSGNVCSLEKNFVPRTEASNYTKIFLDQKDANSPIIVNQSSDRLQIAPQNLPHLRENLLDMTPSSTSLADATVDILENISSTTVVVQPLEVSSESTTNNPADPKKALSGELIGPLLPASTATDEIEQPMKVASDPTTNSQASALVAKKKFSFGLMGPLLEQLRDTMNTSGESADVTSTLQQLGKRKRIRKHRKRSKNANSMENELPAILPTYSTPRSSFSSTTGPSLHLKFESDEENAAERGVKKDNIEISSLLTARGKGDETLQVNGDNKSPVRVIAAEESYTPSLDGPSIFGKESIENALLMGDKLRPKVGDVIAFKILKISNNYTPEFSQYIVGRVKSLADQQTVSFQILSGQEELGPISGKLSLDLTEEVSYPEMQDFKWDQLLGPRLLYP